MTGLYWALETLAWNENYLPRVSVIFGELATIDPGGNWGNRPAESLSTIFLPWLPQTIASLEKRISSINVLIKENLDVAWKLLIKLLPTTSQTSSGTQKPLWRKFIPDEWTKGVTNEEYWAMLVKRHS